MDENKNIEEQKIPVAVQSRLNGWFYAFWGFTICHYLFGIGGVIASCLAASTTDKTTQQVAGVIGAMCVSIIGFVQPDRRFRQYVTAWRLLDNKVNLFRYNLITPKQLIDTMDLSEKIIGQFEEVKHQPRRRGD